MTTTTKYETGVRVAAHLLMVSTDALLLGWAFRLSWLQIFAVAWVLAGVARRRGR